MNVPDAGEPVPKTPKKRSPAYRIGGVLLGVAVVAGIFVGVIPQFASYRDAWTAIARTSPTGKVSFLSVLLSFAIARLAGALPITPEAWAAWTPPSPAC